MSRWYSVPDTILDSSVSFWFGRLTFRLKIHSVGGTLWTGTLWPKRVLWSKRVPTQYPISFFDPSPIRYSTPKRETIRITFRDTLLRREVPLELRLSGEVLVLRSGFAQVGISVLVPLTVGVYSGTSVRRASFDRGRTSGPRSPAPESEVQVDGRNQTFEGRLVFEWLGIWSRRTVTGRLMVTDGVEVGSK